MDKSTVSSIGGKSVLSAIKSNTSKQMFSSKLKNPLAQLEY